MVDEDDSDEDWSPVPVETSESYDHDTRDSSPTRSPSPDVYDPRFHDRMRAEDRGLNEESAASAQDARGR